MDDIINESGPQYMNDKVRAVYDAAMALWPFIAQGKVHFSIDRDYENGAEAAKDLCAACQRAGEVERG